MSEQQMALNKLNESTFYHLYLSSCSQTQILKEPCSTSPFERQAGIKLDPTTHQINLDRNQPYQKYHQ